MAGLGQREGVEPVGRGRAKAKQAKVARELKYSSPTIDLDRLREDLGVVNDSSRDDEAHTHADGVGK
ncbi:DUF3073 domain-containing protein [Rhizohabitans arisaemae]|uniref:DUF3073 domain-containing protein n=1 Tax=Rhizohabitans arisaemae TaxID=2720610 RepID=UPI003D160946